MAGKLPRKQDKGRCNRCYMSTLTQRIGDSNEFEQIPKKTKRVKGMHLYCTKYANDCNRVAWNCTEVH